MLGEQNPYEDDLNPFHRYPFTDFLLNEFTNIEDPNIIRSKLKTLQRPIIEKVQNRYGAYPVAEASAMLQMAGITNKEISTNQLMNTASYFVCIGYEITDINVLLSETPMKIIEFLDKLRLLNIQEFYSDSPYTRENIVNDTTLLAVKSILFSSNIMKTEINREKNKPSRDLPLMILPRRHSNKAN